jgi:NitT/TauT family transport system substrate-binding protein
MDNRILGIIAAASLALVSQPTVALDEVTFGTDWLAQAEHGGYYQAVADGTYEKYGLKVTIRQGGPQNANRALLTGGQVQFYMGGMIQALDAAQEGIPTYTIASIFQKSPTILMAHPESGYEKLDDLASAGKYIIGKDGFITYFRWLQARNPAFVDEKYEPYTFNPGPFLADPTAIQQGFLTSEPYEIERQAGWVPDVFLLADNGYLTYAATIEVMKPWYDDNQDVARRFVEASIVGWYNYLYGDNSAANALIKTDNPEMTDGQLAYSVSKLKEYGIIVSGDSAADGIGCMRADRWEQVYQQFVEVGLFRPGVDVSQAFTTDLVCKGLGKELVK